METARLLTFPKVAIEERADELLAGSGMAPNTVRQYRKAWLDFIDWYGEWPETLTEKEADKLLADHARYLHTRTSDRCAKGQSPKTIYLRSSGIKWFYAEVYEISPRSMYRKWKQAWKMISREGRNRGNGQRTGLSRDDINMLAELAPKVRQGLAGLRDAAYLRMASDGLLRCSEARAVDVDHIERQENGSAILYIPASKTDQTGEGAYVYLGPPAVEAIDTWIEAAGITEGALLISIAGPGTYERSRISESSLNYTVKVLATAAGLKGDYGSHSMRVGMAQELATANKSTASIMEAGRWKQESMVAHYIRHLEPSKGAVASLYESGS